MQGAEVAQLVEVNGLSVEARCFRYGIKFWNALKKADVKSFENVMLYQKHPADLTLDV